MVLPGRSTPISASSIVDLPNAKAARERSWPLVLTTLLVIAYHLLARQQVYHELGEKYFDERQRQSVERRLVGTSRAAGYQVSLTQAA